MTIVGRRPAELQLLEILLFGHRSFGSGHSSHLVLAFGAAVFSWRACNKKEVQIESVSSQRTVSYHNGIDAKYSKVIGIIIVGDDGGNGECDSQWW
jgi:hypothetical protein